MHREADDQLHNTAADGDAQTTINRTAPKWRHDRPPLSQSRLLRGLADRVTDGQAVPAATRSGPQSICLLRFVVQHAVATTSCATNQQRIESLQRIHTTSCRRLRHKCTSHRKQACNKSTTHRCSATRCTICCPA